jgi:NACHT domain
VDALLSQAVSEAATAGAAKVLGSSATMLAGRRRARVLRRSVQGLAEQRTGAVEDILRDLDDSYTDRVIRYVGSADFEQLAIQLTGMALERRRPERYVQDLRESLARSLCLHEAVPSGAAESLADRLFQELWAAVVQFVGEIDNPPGVRELPGLTVSVSVRAAAAARNCQLLKRLETLAEFRDFAIALRGQVHKVEGQIRPPRAEGGRRVPLSKIYVRASLIRNRADQHAGHVERFTAAEALAAHLRVVVLGDPGGGKSTLCAWTAYRLAGATAPGGDPFQVPFLVVMREYAPRFEREQMSLARYIEVMIGGRYQIQSPAECVDFLLLNGHAVVILDGLDELLDTALRRRVSEAVEAFAHAYPTTPMLVTSRRIGYSQAPLDSGLFAAFRLDDFGPDQVEDYSRKWFNLDSSLPAQQRRELADSFMSESRFVEDLRRSPLILALMCALYRGDGYIPRNLLDVYERCAVLLFEGWDRQRGIPVPLPFELHLRPAVCHLALWMYTDSDRQSGVTERELVATVTRFLLVKRFEDPDEAEAAARAFVAYCRGRAWVLTEAGTTADGEPLFIFTHRTFLEFFAASQLVRTLPTPAELFAHLEPHIRVQEWDAAAQLAVLLLERNVEAGADIFVKLLIRDTETSASIAERVACLSFAARLMFYLIPSPPVLRELFAACWGLACSLDADEILDAMVTEGPYVMGPAASLLHAQQENWAALARMIGEHAVANPDSGISPLISVTLDQLVCKVDLRQRSLTRALRAFWHGESIRNATHLRPVFTAAASQHPWAAVEAVFGRAWTVEQLVRVHGPQAACEESPSWATYRRAPILIQEVLASSRFTWADNEQDSRLLPSIWLDPVAGSLTEELARILPLSLPPWARLSRVVFWDMSVEEPADTAPVGSSAFNLAVLCACLTYEARLLARAHGFSHAEPLPNWLRTPPRHPLTRLVNNAARARYTQETRQLHWNPAGITAPVEQVVRGWATRQIDLVTDDISKGAADTLFEDF